jgi:hypothetical protein
MNTLSIRLRYRPLRLGWCVLKGDMDAFRRAVRLSFTIWGGRYNPIIPVDDRKTAEALVKLFRAMLSFLCREIPGFVISYRPTFTFLGRG